MISCEGCFHLRIVDVLGRKNEMCDRLQTSRLGKKRRGVGAVFETDSLPEPHRAEGDKCGPDRKHWRAKQ